MKAADDVRLPVLPQTPLASGHDIPPERELHLASKSAEESHEVKKVTSWGDAICLEAADGQDGSLDLECARWWVLKAMTAPEDSELFSMLLEFLSSAVMCNGFWTCRHNVAEGSVLWKKELSDMLKVFFASTADILVGDLPLSLVELLRSMQSTIRGIRGLVFSQAGYGQPERCRLCHASQL